MNVAQHTVEFDVALEDGTRVGSMVTWALPNHGDQLRVDEPDKQPIYEVLCCRFEPDNITVIVRPVGELTPVAEGSASPFYSQQPGAGGFQ